jgi:hypothetical protein
MRLSNLLYINRKRHIPVPPIFDQLTNFAMRMNLNKTQPEIYRSNHEQQPFLQRNQAN